METKTSTVAAPDGRVLCVESGGDPAGRPVLVHGGTPNTRHLANPWPEDALNRGVHLLGYDRPGYGGSSPQPGRSVADCANDVRTIADAFGIDKLAVWGLSGGGPHALACAALLPDLVSAVASLASLVQDRDEVLTRDPETLFESWATLLSPEDAGALTHDFASYLVVCGKTA